MKINCLILLLFSLFLTPVTLHAWQGKVIRVTDGDTIKVKQRFMGDTVTIRLYGIDAPERDQSFGRKATRRLSRLINRETVEIKEIDKDQYGRTVAIVSYKKQSINRAMIQDGYAWVYKKYCRKSFCNAWEDIETDAKREERGLWSDKDPIPPWEWRKREDTFTEKLMNFIDNIIWMAKKILSYIDLILRIFND